MRRATRRAAHYTPGTIYYETAAERTRRIINDWRSLLEPRTETGRAAALVADSLASAAFNRRERAWILAVHGACGTHQTRCARAALDMARDARSLLQLPG